MFFAPIPFLSTDRDSLKLYFGLIRYLRAAVRANFTILVKPFAIHAQINDGALTKIIYAVVIFSINKGAS
jgi:hypothetical protein|tara:strand:+ start:141 stop:350 length:210 start_codon:yes stop_codon:yes gene_type:complete